MKVMRQQAKVHKGRSKQQWVNVSQVIQVHSLQAQKKRSRYWGGNLREHLLKRLLKMHGNGTFIIQMAIYKGSDEMIFQHIEGLIQQGLNTKLIEPRSEERRVGKDYKARWM